MQLICPKHWQLPSATVKWNKDYTAHGAGEVQLVDGSFYKWLNSYGWQVIGWSNYTGAALPTWQNTDGTRYDIKLNPFFLSNGGEYLYRTGLEDAGAFLPHWSNTAGPRDYHAGVLIYDGYFLVPAAYNTVRSKAYPLRCLTQ